MNLPKRIQAVRKAKGISQEELANVIGVSRQAVSKWESGQSVPDLDKIIALSEYFELSTDLSSREKNRRQRKRKATGRRLQAGYCILGRPF